MTSLFYSLPGWIAAVLVLGLALAVGLGCSVGVQRSFRLKPTDEEKEIAINLMQVVAAYIGIMLAFAGVAVWQNFADADTAVHQEAATAAELYRDLTTYGPETQATRGDLRAYIGSILHDEWPSLRDGHGSLATEAALGRIFVELGNFNPQSNRDSAIFTEFILQIERPGGSQAKPNYRQSGRHTADSVDRRPGRIDFDHFIRVRILSHTLQPSHDIGHVGCHRPCLPVHSDGGPPIQGRIQRPKHRLGATHCDIRQARSTGLGQP